MDFVLTDNWITKKEGWRENVNPLSLNKQYGILIYGMFVHYSGTTRTSHPALHRAKRSDPEDEVRSRSLVLNL
ncbi:hypothetical protein [Vibrio sp. T11.5]|uniref:hypothetical protein n=1 Tax=Vibrio sp. T11.5 TaxID=2998836 RepID=UPI0022CD6326|nr:hypothetical protein [Vibrio sp. T11.5]MDA0120109.1 hypothetical protein [Vibrio sp. T11.5]